MNRTDVTSSNALNEFSRPLNEIFATVNLLELNFVYSKQMKCERKRWYYPFQ